MIVAFFSVVLLAVALAWALAAREPRHRPVAVLLTYWVVAEAGLHLLDVAAVAPLREALGTAAPWEGPARALALGYHALGLSVPAAVLAGALRAFARVSAAWAGAAWVLVVAVFALAHPVGRDQEVALGLADAAFAAGAAAVAIRWFFRARAPADSAQFALAVVVAGESASLFGAWRVGPFGAWDVSRALYAASFAALAAAQGRWLWKPRSLACS